MKESIEEMRIRLVKEHRLNEAKERQQHSLLKYEKTAIVAKEMAEGIKSALIKSIKKNPISCSFKFEISFDAFIVDLNYLKQLMSFAFPNANVSHFGHSRHPFIYLNFNFDPVEVEPPKVDPIEPHPLSRERFMEILGDEFKSDMVIHGCTFTNNEK